jgi:carbamoyl-phosphate synthase large subunit
MATRLLLTGAGTGAANNLVRSLRAGDVPLVIIGCHSRRFVLTQSAADRNYLIPAAPSGSIAGLDHVIKAECIDLVVPTTDADVLALARHRDRLACRVFLPRRSVVERCADKYELARVLQRQGVPVPETVPIRGLADVEAAYRRLGPKGRAWCRVRRGSGALGAIDVRRPEQARAWIAYWQGMRGIPGSSFTLSEYLPGRDFACQSLWKDGTLVLVKAVERLEYFVDGGQPSRVSSVAALARTVRDLWPVDVATAAVKAVDPRATGVFSVDLKENARGEPCVTEINAGRFLSGTTLLDLTGRHNMATTYVRLAVDEPPVIETVHDTTDGDYYMVRGFDVVPRILRADELFDTIVDVQFPPRSMHAATRRRRTSAVVRRRASWEAATGGGRDSRIA